MRVSVQVSTLLQAGYASPLDGLDDLSLRRVELELSPSGEAVRLDAAGWSSAPVTDEGSARAYRESLYALALSVSGLSVAYPPDDILDDAALTRALLAVQAADILGAPVVRIDAPGDPARSLASLERLDEQTAGMRAVLALTFPAPGSETNPRGLEADEREADGSGLALHVGGLFAGSRLGSAWGTLRAIAPHVRCVVCDTGPMNADDAAAPVALAASGIDYARIAAMLGKVGHAGSLTVSLAGRETAGKDVLRADVAYLKDILGEY